MPRHGSDKDQRHWETTAGSTFKNFALERTLAATTGSDGGNGSVIGDDQGLAGFKYDASLKADPLPFPGPRTERPDQWGTTRAQKDAHFGKHHVTTSSRMFVDYRGIDPPRLGIVSPLDGEGPPLPLPSSTGAHNQHKNIKRKNVIAGSQTDNERKPGLRVWQDYEPE